MTLLFFLAVLFAIPTTGLSLLAWFILFVLLRHINRKGLQHKSGYDTAMGAAYAEIASNSFAVPSWLNETHPQRGELFGGCVARTLFRQGLSKEEFKEWTGNKFNRLSTYTVAASFEKHGFNFLEQLVAVEDYIKRRTNNC